MKDEAIRRAPHLSRYYVIVFCLRSSDKWRRRLDAVDGLDWALTRLKWLIDTYLDRPTIFHINLLNLARQIGKMATRIDRQFLTTSDPLLRSGPLDG